MEAAVLIAPNEMDLTQVKTPTVSDGEVVIRVKAACICGSDLRLFRGKRTHGVSLPRIIGHEFSGVVADTGTGVSNLSVGDNVTVLPDFFCGTCLYCRNGMENLCLQPQALGYDFDGAFAEYVRIPANGVADGHVVRLPQGMAIRDASIAEPLACCLNGQERAEISSGDFVVVMGGGAIGMMHVQLAKAAGARHVLLSEPSEVRRTLAARLGADTVCDPTSENLEEIVKDLTDGVGADAVMVAIGIPVLANAALGLVRKRGRVNLFAGFSSGDMSSMDVNLIHYNELIVTGTSGSARRHFARAMELIEGGSVDAKELVTHFYPLSEIDEAFACAERGSGLKVAVTVD